MGDLPSQLECAESVHSINFGQYTYMQQNVLSYPTHKKKNYKKRTSDSLALHSRQLLLWVLVDSNCLEIRGHIITKGRSSECRVISIEIIS